MKIYAIVSDNASIFDNEQLQRLNSAGTLKIISHKGKLTDILELKGDSESKIIGLDPDAFDWELDVDAFRSISHVRAVCTQSTSFDWVKPQELAALGIKVCNCPGFSTDAVAEYALAMAIEGARRFAVIVKNGWKIDWTAQPMLLKGKTAGIIGLGRIGKRIAEVMQGIGMNIIYYSIKSRDSRFKLVSLEEVLKQADVIMPALIENKATKKLISRKLIDAVKPNAIIVGMNRIKALFDEEYILQKVAKGEIGGYAFEGNNYKELKSYQGNVWALPPMAWFTHDSLQNLNEMWVNNLVAAASGKPQNIIGLDLFNDR